MPAPGRSNNEEIDELVDRRRFEALLITAQIEDRGLLLGREFPPQVGAELGFKQRYALLAAAAVPDRILDLDVLGLAAVLEEHLDRIRDRTLARVEIVARPLLFLDALHFRA